jgi:glyoxylase-like metal-dependent hydrolase (beta-lactamase superfamily II)
MAVHADTTPLTGPLPGGNREGATVVVEPLLGGESHCPPAALERAGGRLELLRMLGFGTPRSRWWWVPLPAFLIHHPSAGPVLVDTALHPSAATRPSANLGRLGARIVKPRLEHGHDVPAQLRARGIDPKSIRTVVMTHLHLDHAGGIPEFPNAAFVVSAAEWEAATTDRRPLLRGYIPAQFDYLFDYRTIDYDSAAVSSYASFGRTIDLFGDGTIRVAFTPGHTAGHQSVIARLADRDLVIAGDAIYTSGQLDGAPEPPRPVDPHNWRRSQRELQRFHERYPDAIIVPGHDPEAWAKLRERYA